MGKRLRTKDIAKMAGVAMSTVTWWANSGKLEGEKVERPVSEGGDQYLFEEENVIAFLEKKYEKYQSELKTLQKRFNTIEENINVLETTNY